MDAGKDRLYRLLFGGRAALEVGATQHPLVRAPQCRPRRGLTEPVALRFQGVQPTQFRVNVFQNWLRDISFVGNRVCDSGNNQIEPRAHLPVGGSELGKSAFLCRFREFDESVGGG